MPFLDRRRIVMLRVDQLVLQIRNVLNSVVLERVQAGVERLLFGEQDLNARQIATVIVRADVDFFFA